MAFKTLDDLGDIAGKRALVRVDLNVPFANGRVTDNTRMQPIVPTISELASKGGKQRMVPVLPITRAAVADYARQCPWPLNPAEPLFRGAKGGPLSPGMVQKAMAQAGKCPRSCR